MSEVCDRLVHERDLRTSSRCHLVIQKEDLHTQRAYYQSSSPAHTISHSTEHLLVRLVPHTQMLGLISVFAYEVDQARTDIRPKILCVRNELNSLSLPISCTLCSHPSKDHVLTTLPLIEEPLRHQSKYAPLLLEINLHSWPRWTIRPSPGRQGEHHS